MNSWPDFANYLASTHACLDSLQILLPEIQAGADCVAQCLRNGHKLLVAGNGGSCSQAQHLTAEVVGRFQTDRGSLPAICLGCEAATATSIINDFGADALFSRQVEAFGQAGDVFLGITTSGNSPNIIAALQTARRLGLKTIGWLGRDGGDALGLCDFAVVVPNNTTAHIQEAHLVVLHYFAAVVDSVATADCPPAG